METNAILGQNYDGVLNKLSGWNVELHVEGSCECVCGWYGDLIGSIFFAFTVKRKGDGEEKKRERERESYRER